MREILDEIFVNQPLDPMESARRGAIAPLRKRFYAAATAGEPTEAGVPVLLDGRSVRTPSRNVLAAPTAALAAALAAEWQAQGELIDPAKMPLTRLANSVIDGVAPAPQPVVDEIVKYLGSDLLVYRAEAPAGLVALQTARWDPVLAWARDTLGAQFILSQGVMFVAQPERAVAAAAAAIPADAWRIGALSAMTSLTGSALLSLAVLHKRLTAAEAWSAAHADEDWQESQWGEDLMARQRRDGRWIDMQAAATMLHLAAA